MSRVATRGKGKRALWLRLARILLSAVSLYALLWALLGRFGFSVMVKVQLCQLATLIVVSFIGIWHEVWTIRNNKAGKVP